MYFTILFCFSLLLVRFFVLGVGSFGSSGKREGQLCLGERLGISTALCPPG